MGYVATWQKALNSQPDVGAGWLSCSRVEVVPKRPSWCFMACLRYSSASWLALKPLLIEPVVHPATDVGLDVFT
jgi:hypothetical protein